MKKQFNIIKNSVKLYFDKYSDNPQLYPIRLTQNEQNKLIETLETSKNYLEFGVGGSTFLALIHSNAQITGVESDANWIKYLKSWKIINKNVNKRLHFLHVDIGPTGVWGYPTEIKNNEFKFPHYSKNVFCNTSNDFDTVFIDGRFRVACALQLLLNCAKNTKIFIHDFTFRREYHKILEFFDITDQTDTLVLLKIKENFDKNKVLKMYDEYKFNYN